MKKIIIILSALLCTCGIYSQTFKEFFANNSIDGNLNSKYYNIDYDDLRVYLSDQNLTDLEGLDTLSIKNRSIADFNRLTIFLSNNQITSLPQEISKLTNLQTLSLSKNKLTSLPEIFDRLTNLCYLDLSNNNLTSLPESFDSLTNLCYLNLSNNNLISLPESFNKLIKLHELHLSNNNLTSLPESFGSLTYLWILCLSSNHLASLPNSIDTLTNLQKLNLNNNPLTRMPLNLLKKPKLQHSLNDTPLGAALYYSKLKNTEISDSRLQPILISSFYHNYENEKPNLSDFKSPFALELIKNISSLFKAKTLKASSYNPMSRMTLPRTILKEQFNKQRTKKRKIEETESVEYQLPQEIIRNIYTYLD